jgi:hypothetical protein
MNETGDLKRQESGAGNSVTRLIEGAKFLEPACKTSHQKEICCHGRRDEASGGILWKLRVGDRLAARGEAEDKRHVSYQSCSIKGPGNVKSWWKWMGSL